MRETPLYVVSPGRTFFRLAGPYRPRNVSRPVSTRRIFGAALLASF
jgi:hypothetical protein